MKFIVAFVCFGLFIGAQALTDAQKERLRTHGKICAAETAIERELMKRIHGGDFEFQDEKANDYVFCILKRIGLVNEDGDFLKDVALSKIDEKVREFVGLAIDNCIKSTGVNKQERAFNYLKCYHKERPDHPLL